MRINPTDSNYVGRSPCHGCEIDEAGWDKTPCFVKCKALAAYRDHGGWKGVPRLTKADFDNSNKKQQPEKSIEVEVVEVKPKDEGRPADDDNSCLICGKKYYCRDLCSQCYGRWIYGTVEHPVLGKFKFKDGTRKKQKNPEKDRSRKERQLRNAVSLDFARYTDLREAITRISVESLLPVQAVVMNLLSEAVMARSLIEN